MIWNLERDLWQQGYKCIAGIDEVGRGSLSGPVVTCAYIAANLDELPPVRDSKQLSPNQRKQLYNELVARQSYFSIGLASATEIDEINVLQSTKLAMARAVKALSKVPDLLLIDALELPDIELPQRAIVKGDSKSGSIAAASIIAKVTRDTIMERLHKKYPEYQFNCNKGYGTLDHMKALRKYGPCKLHRMSFNGVYQPKLVL